MLLQNIYDTNGFFKTIDGCQGEVDMIAPDGRAYPWGSCADVVKSMSLCQSPLERIELRLHDMDDACRVIRFMYDTPAVDFCQTY